MEDDFKEFVKTLSSYIDKKVDLDLIESAWEFAKLAHTGQKRYSGDPYVIHSLETAKILASWKLDIPTIIAGMLHDTVEDGGANFDDITSQFGNEVAHLVDGVTKISHIKLRASVEEEFVENLRKMFLAMAKDLRVILVKLADRLHNIRTISFIPEGKKEKFALETLEIYAPLAERLGMGRVSSEFEDLAFPYAYPKEYERVIKGASVSYKKAEQNIKKMKRRLLKILASNGIRAKISGRKKSYFALWKKLERLGIEWDFSKIFDIVALRILVDTVADCYVALGVVHGTFKLAPHYGISDFIAQPKPNGYQSIHTRVFAPDGKVTEVQIRTFDMHEQAEHGIAAHWAYSEQKKKTKAKDDVLEKSGAIVSEDKLAWVKKLAEWQKEISDSKEFLEAVKFDALRERIFVYTPQGDVFDLPEGATPVDFAYAVHTDLADYLKAAKADGKIVPLNYKLKSGQVLEILKTKNSKPPNNDWLDFVVTNTARREIKKGLKKIDKS